MGLVAYHKNITKKSTEKLYSARTLYIMRVPSNTSHATTVTKTNYLPLHLIVAVMCALSVCNCLQAAICCR